MGIGCHIRNTFLSIRLKTDGTGTTRTVLKLLSATRSYCKKLDVMLIVKKTNQKTKQGTCSLKRSIFGLATNTLSGSTNGSTRALHSNLPKTSRMASPRSKKTRRTRMTRIARITSPRGQIFLPLCRRHPENG